MYKWEIYKLYTEAEKKLEAIREIIENCGKRACPDMLKTYRVRVVNQTRTGLVWHEVMAVNEKEALLMANYISWESWEA